MKINCAGPVNACAIGLADCLLIKTMSRFAESNHVVSLLESLAGHWVCVDGGWGVDALLGKQSRPHDDLDLIIKAKFANDVFDALTNRGFLRQTERDGIVYSNGDLDVDLHVVQFDRDGFGHFDLPNQKTWPFPPQAFQGRGTIANLEVQCLSLDAQIQCHFQGYELTEKDRADMLLLQGKFGCVLPLSFYLTSKP